MNIYFTEIIFSTSSGLTVDQLTSIMRGLTHTLPTAPADPNPEETQEQRGLKYTDNHGPLSLSSVGKTPIKVNPLAYSLRGE
jgi:hypothetical protein